jgi:alkylated DNA repair dioxygenase AlkB
VAWHSDDEKELGKNPVIGSVSFGAERTFKLRHKQYKENNLKQSIVLKNGSFLLMKGATQHHWMHEIPRTAKPIGPRINLTFRVIQ